MGEAKELTDDPDGIYGFVERYDGWTGRAWLEIRGRRSRWLRIDGAYGPRRAAWREAFPERPFTSEWADGRFPAVPFGLPLGPVLVLGYALAATLVVAASWLAGPVAAGLAVVAVGWPLLRLLDAVEVTASGVRLGPPWAPLVPWHEVEALGVVAEGRTRASVWVRTRRGGGRAPVPALLVPALRARIRRLSGWALQEQGPTITDRYAVWREVASALPWGIFAGILGAAWFTPWPWRVVATGGLVVAGLGLLAAAVEARATGFRLGAVVSLMLLYGLLLAILSAGSLGASWWPSG